MCLWPPESTQGVRGLGAVLWWDPCHGLRGWVPSWPSEMLPGKQNLLSLQGGNRRVALSSRSPLPWVCLAGSGVPSFGLLWESC